MRIQISFILILLLFLVGCSSSASAPSGIIDSYIQEELGERNYDTPDVSGLSTHDVIVRINGRMVRALDNEQEFIDLAVYHLSNPHPESLERLRKQAAKYYVDTIEMTEVYDQEHEKAPEIFQAYIELGKQVEIFREIAEIFIEYTELDYSDETDRNRADILIRLDLPQKQKERDESLALVLRLLQ